MATVTLRYFLFLIVVCCVLLSSNLNATTVDFSAQSSIVKTSSGLFFRKTPTGTTALAGPGDIFNIDNQFKVPTKNGLVPVSVARSAPVDLPRIGSAVGKFAQKVGPVGMAIGTATLICDLSDICDNAGEWFFGTPSESLTGFGSCETVSYGQFYNYLHTNGTLYEYQRITLCETIPAGWGLVSNCPATQESCFNGERLLQKVTPGVTPPEYRTATEQDFIDAEPALSDPQFIEPLFEAGENVPVNLPAGIPPVNTITGSSTKTLKDANGNVTGSEVTERSVTLTDVSTVDEPNKYEVTETEKVTTYDANNVKTSETETTSEAEPTTENEEPVTFDNVSDVELEEKEVSAILDTSSWGGGSCPAPIAMDTTFGSYQFDTQPFCDYPEALKPFILIVASIIAGLIILRSRQT
jgi:hypothetical protein